MASTVWHLLHTGEYAEVVEMNFFKCTRCYSGGFPSKSRVANWPAPAFKAARTQSMESSFLLPASWQTSSGGVQRGSVCGVKTEVCLQIPLKWYQASLEKTARQLCFVRESRSP